MRLIIRTCVVAVVAICASPAFAERPLTGAEAHRLLAGKTFQLQCVDGTRGVGAFARDTVSVSYRLANAEQGEPALNDRAAVRAQGNEICVAWKQFGGGGEGCYPIAEKAAGSYRIGSGIRWCDIRAK
jgi:hypothetical protein